LQKIEPDKGTTNVRNTTNAQGKTNAHWRLWLRPANRCLVPFTPFAEPDQDHERTRKNWSRSTRVWVKCRAWPQASVT
jgi:putative SOS response-associated peptidase YedK